MLNIEELQNMKNINIMQVEREQLVDLNEIYIDSSKSVDSRVKEYMEQVQNPFLVKVGDYILKFEYADCEKGMDERMMEYVSKIAQIKY